MWTLHQFRWIWCAGSAWPYYYMRKLRREKSVVAQTFPQNLYSLLVKWVSEHGKNSSKVKLEFELAYDHMRSGAYVYGQWVHEGRFLFRWIRKWNFYICIIGRSFFRAIFVPLLLIFISETLFWFPLLILTSTLVASQDWTSHDPSLMLVLTSTSVYSCSRNVLPRTS
jgi:hypothetical protein